MDKMAEKFVNEWHTSRETRAGLLLCMMLCALVDEERPTEFLREIALVADHEPEFTGRLDEFEKVLELAETDLKNGEADLLERIKSLLKTKDQRRRGLELAVRVVTSDGIVTREQGELLEVLRDGLELSPDTLKDAVVRAQKRLVRFMMIYLVYLTALSDGVLRPEEFEQMMPAALALPAFSGVTTEEFAHICHSVRSHLEEMRTDKGIDYIARTLVNASELLDNPGLPEQALRLVARGIFADEKIDPKEREFFMKIADKLKVQRDSAEVMVPQ